MAGGVVGHGGEDGRADLIKLLDTGQVADHREGILAEVFQEGPLDLGDAGQVDAAGSDHLAPSLVEWISMAHPPVVAGCPAQGFRPPG